jgi:hypothetical protein
MALHAIDAISDAVTATRRYRPRGAFEWLWVIFVTVLAGSPMLSLPTGGQGGGGSQQLSPEARAQLQETLPAGIAEILVTLAVALAALWVVVVVLGALLEFPLLRWLETGETAIRDEIGEHWRQALGLAVFRLVVGSLSFLLLGGLVVSQVGTDGTVLDYLMALNDTAVIVGLLGVPTSIVLAFTTGFVVPTMLLEDSGVIGGWRRFWETLVGAPKQFAAYTVAAFVIGTVGGILVFLAALVVAVPALVVGGLLALVVSLVLSSTAAVAVVATISGTATTAALLAGLAIFQVFARYYALLILGDVDDELDVIPERRRELRSGDGGDADHGDHADADSPDSQFST